MFLNNVLVKWGMEEITFRTVLPIKVDHCFIEKEGALLMLPQIDRALLRNDESRKHCV
jgi:hypothetical protein